MGPNPTEPASLVYRFIGLHLGVMFQATNPPSHGDPFVPSTMSSYLRFKMALKSKEVQRQYPNLLEKFLDYCRFGGSNVEQKATNFYLFAKSTSQDEAKDLIIGFIVFQMERIDRGEITSGTVKNYLNRLRLFFR